MLFGIKHDFRADEIDENGTFLIATLQDSILDDPDGQLERVKFLLKHKANPNFTLLHPNGYRLPTICMASTYAIARCLLDYKADPHGGNTQEALRYILDDRYCFRSPETKSKQIALLCKAGVKLDTCTCDGLSPCTFVLERHHLETKQNCTVIDTLIKAGAPLDEHFKRACDNGIRALEEANLIKKTVQQAQTEVETVRTTRHHAVATILQEVGLFKDPAGIVADYQVDPHEHFIDTILADADAELQRKHKEREEALTTPSPSCCIIQ
ncbi:MAG: hypothetical protein ACHQVS_03485 [Candidatus Babeliales bacterium]